MKFTVSSSCCNLRLSISYKIEETEFITKDQIHGRAAFALESMIIVERTEMGYCQRFVSL